MRILYLISRYYHDRKMDHGRVLHGKAIARRPDVELRWWGPGWPEYDNGKTVQANADARGWQPDAILTHKPQDVLGLAKARAPRIIFFYDAYAIEKTRQEIDEADANLVVFAQESDVVRWGETLEAEGRQVARVPNCAEKSVFYRDDYGERPIDCLLTGARHGEVYPLRERWIRLIESGRIPGEVRQYPGHRRANLDATQRELRSYAAHLRRSKILLCDSSAYRLFLQRFAEGAAAGCAIVSDMPDDPLFRGTLGQHIVEVRPDESDDVLTHAVNALLASPVEIRLRADELRAEYLRGHTTDHYAARFVAAAGSLL